MQHNCVRTIALVLCASSTVAMADRVKLTGGGPNGGGEFDASVDLGNDNIIDLTFVTFCLEKNEFFSKNTWYEYKITDRAVGGGNNDDDAGGADGNNDLGYDIISSRTAWIYNEWRKAGNGALSAYTEGNVQNAIWQEKGRDHQRWRQRARDHRSRAGGDRRRRLVRPRQRPCHAALGRRRHHDRQPPGSAPHHPHAGAGRHGRGRPARPRRDPSPPLRHARINDTSNGPASQAGPLSIAHRESQDKT